jgi:hypothetical protein
VDKGRQPKRKRYPQIALPKGMLVSWQVRIAWVVSTATTLGLSGVFFSTPKPLVVGDLVKLVLHAPDGDIRAVAVVRDSRPGRGMGVEFTSMGRDDRARLRQLLKRLI